MEKNEFIHKYLKRINFQDELSVDIETLRKLHKQHLLTVPFENLDIFLGKKIKMDIESFFKKIVEEGRGGLCYELNGLLFSFLKELGFKVKLVSGKVLEDGSVYDHAFIIATIEEETWLVDVGFGDSYHYPIKLSIGEVQEDDNRYFKIERYGEEEYELLRSMDNEAYSIEYIFSLKERELLEFEERCLYFQFSPDSRFKKNRICSLEKENGRVSLKDDKLTVTSNGNQVITKVEGEEEFACYLKEFFNMNYKKL